MELEALLAPPPSQALVDAEIQQGAVIAALSAAPSAATCLVLEALVDYSSDEDESISVLGLGGGGDDGCVTLPGVCSENEGDDRSVESTGAAHVDVQRADVQRASDETAHMGLIDLCSGDEGDDHSVESTDDLAARGTNPREGASKVQLLRSAKNCWEGHMFKDEAEYDKLLEANIKSFVKKELEFKTQETRKSRRLFHTGKGTKWPAIRKT